MLMENGDLMFVGLVNSLPMLATLYSEVQFMYNVCHIYFPLFDCNFSKVLSTGVQQTLI